MQFKNFINKSAINQPVYHSSNFDFRKFNFKNAAQKIIWFTSDLESLKRQEKGAQGSKIIYTLNIDLKNPAGWEEYETLFLDELRLKGYDGAILPNENGFDGFVFSPNQIKIIDKQYLK